MLSWIFIVLAHWNNSPRIDMSPHSVTLSCMIPDQPVFSLSPYCCVLSREATNTNYIVFSLTRSGIEPTIYHTRRPDQGLNPRSTTLDDPIRDWTHDLPHSTRACSPLHYQCGQGISKLLIFITVKKEMLSGFYHLTCTKWVLFQIFLEQVVFKTTALSMDSY
jgi:hypothetical protein